MTRPYFELHGARGNVQDGQVMLSLSRGWEVWTPEQAIEVVRAVEALAVEAKGLRIA